MIVMTYPIPQAAHKCVALLIAAPASGQGKTTITAALARWHTRQGRRVLVFKCGPDYLDPYWHELASGTPVQNIDGWMVGMKQVRAYLFEAAQQADVILIEGVMGLFDGRPTAADLAEQLGIPILLVVDASAMAGSFGALVLGMQHYQPTVTLAGVLANRVGSAMHAQMLESSLRDASLWLGAVERLGEGKDAKLLPERHLGLIAAQELPDAMARLDAAADALDATLLCQLPWQAWQRWAVEFEAVDGEGETVPPLLRGKSIAVARDSAFSFIYPANLACLKQLGAEVRFFSPLAGERLPACDAIWLPGGYPELHAPELMSNEGLRHDLQSHIEQGKPVWAECGGMMALGESITDSEGTTQPMWGVIPGHSVMQTKLGGLGMQQCSLQEGVLRGHTFHYSRFESNAQQVGRTSRAGQAVNAQSGEVIYAYKRVHASYFHAWFASHPRAVAALLGAEPISWGGACHA